MRRIITGARAIATSDNLDLYLLVAVAFPLTVLGVVGVASQQWVSACVLALLGLLALSQIRSRQMIGLVTDAQRVDPLGRLLTDFPPDLAPRRVAATDILLIGTTLSRTIQSYRRHIPAMLGRGGRIRIVVLDPDVAALHPFAEGDSFPLQRRVRNSLEELSPFLGMGGNLEIRTCPEPVSSTFNVLDPHKQDGLIVVQRQEFRPQSESAPIIALTPQDGLWYRHFLDEAERMWAISTQWDPHAASHLPLATTPQFVQTFNDDLWDALGVAKELLITGVARNTLLNTHFHHFERALAAGCRLRVLLVDPDSSAVVASAERYYAERSAEPLRGRIRHSRQLLHELKRLTAGDIELRYTTYALPVALIAIRISADIAGEWDGIFMEYYALRSA